MKKENVVEFVKREEKPKFMDQVKKKGSDIWEFTKENKEIVVPLLTGIVSGGAIIAKTLIKRKSVTDEKYMKEHMIYDRSNGHYVESKKKLTGNDWLWIDQRHKQGDSYAKILDDMNLLK